MFPFAEPIAASSSTGLVLSPFDRPPHGQLGFPTEAIYTPARVNVTCVTPLGEEVVSTS
jgi:hypothetical protein